MATANINTWTHQQMSPLTPSPQQEGGLGWQHGIEGARREAGRPAGAWGLTRRVSRKWKHS